MRFYTDVKLTSLYCYHFSGPEGAGTIAASFVSSSFPVFDIWRAHQHADSDEQLARIDLTKGSQNILISRPGSLEIGVTMLGPGDTALLTAVVGHRPFLLACEAAVLAEVGYDLGSGRGNLVVSRAFGALAKGIEVTN
jgi:hypothetical protein